MDKKWTDHRDAIDHAYNAVGLRGYAQNNPVVEYQAEGFRMFNDMRFDYEFDVTRLMMKANSYERKTTGTERYQYNSDSRYRAAPSKYARRFGFESHWTSNDLPK